MNPALSHEDLKRVIHYNPETGVFTWLPGTHFAGRKAGSLDALGYITIHILKCRTKAHRWAWFYMTGDWPTYANLGTSA